MSQLWLLQALRTGEASGSGGRDRHPCGWFYDSHYWRRRNGYSFDFFGLAVIEQLRRLIVGLALAGVSSCGGVGPPPGPVPTPTPAPACMPEVQWCSDTGQTCSSPSGPCKHNPTADPNHCELAAPCPPGPTPTPTPTPTPPPGTGCVLSGAGVFLGTIPQPVVDGQPLGWHVNQAMSSLIGCPVGSRCIVTARPQVWQAAVEAELRKRGFCAGQHEPGTDEIAVAVEAGKPMFGYHIYAGDGWDDPTKPGTIVWFPGAERPAYAPPDSVPQPPDPTPSPTPVPGPCPIAPCPTRTWTLETLPPGWGADQIGKPAYEVKARMHTMGNADATAVVIRQEPFCRAIGLSPYADGQPRASCPVRPDGHSERVPVENWLLFGGFTRDSRNGQDCTPNNTDNPAAFLGGTGNCRSCNVPKTACSEWF